MNEIHDVCGKGLMAGSNSRKTDGTLYLFQTLIAHIVG